MEILEVYLFLSKLSVGYLRGFLCMEKAGIISRLSGKKGAVSIGRALRYRVRYGKKNVFPLYYHYCYAL